MTSLNDQELMGLAAEGARTLDQQEAAERQQLRNRAAEFLLQP